jgi:mannitol 2-dehydrogenase
LTVTEGGYFLNNESKLDLENSQVTHDIENPDQPTTVFGLVIKALKERKEQGMPPFTVMSCDNIPHNGHVTRDVVLEFATKMYGPELADWISSNARFPNSMVDRITPALTAQSTPEITKLIEDKFGYTDNAPILCEPFRQWVLEDTFVNGERPHWELLESVSIVDDVAPYENMKIRILNGGHASLCYPAALLGLKYVHNAIGHPTISQFMDILERTEIIPTLGPVPDTDLEEYWGIIASRFANPTLQDTISRICFDGANRQPKFIVPVVRDALAKAAATGDDAGSYGGVVDGLSLVSAMWCRYCQGVTEAGEVIEPNDPDWDYLQKLAIEAKSNPTVWLDSLTHVYGGVGQNPDFREAFEKAMASIDDKGVEGAMQAYIDANTRPSPF